MVGAPRHVRESLASNLQAIQTSVLIGMLLGVLDVQPGWYFQRYCDPRGFAALDELSHPRYQRP